MFILDETIKHQIGCQYKPFMKLNYKQIIGKKHLISVATCVVKIGARILFEHMPLHFFAQPNPFPLYNLLDFIRATK